ncbi:tetratricopeptide repeat protein [Cryptosporangium japonicum]|uniref:tetratricopeptide repeat protein n=1 Tax=Cryptosporangium japonicum TaxID=80872 RepID=UPI0031DA58DD
MKQILQYFGLTPDNRDPLITPSLRLFYPLDDQLAAFVRAGAISLTDAATSAEQIRFFQQRRADRHHVKVSELIASTHGPVTIRIGNCSAIDTPSRAFLQLAAAVAGWTVTYTEEPTGAVPASPSAAETRLLDAVHERRIRAEADLVWRSAFEYVNVGDAWTGVNLGRRLAAVEPSARVWNLLALSFAMLNESENAQFYYDKWAADGDDVDEIRALYGKSMLYARHHPDGLRDLDECARILDSAYAIIQRLDPATRAEDTMVFDEVFNRNGYALVLYRRGEVDEALALLENGIGRLTQTGEKVAIHRSVLIYNLAQCHKQLGRIDDAIATYQRLLDVDPFMPEYHLESAKCLAAADRYDEAVAACRTAIDLDRTLPVAWTLLGLYLGESEHFADAAAAYERAAALDPAHRPVRIDAAYYWILAEEVEKASAALDSVPTDRLADSEFERYASLLAEVHLRRGDDELAVETLTSALKRLPDSTTLRENRAVLAPA